MFIRCEVPGTHAAAPFAGTSAPAPLDGKLYVLIIKQWFANNISTYTNEPIHFNSYDLISCRPNYMHFIHNVCSWDRYITIGCIHSNIHTHPSQDE